VVTVHDHVEAAGVQDVDHGQPARPLVDERLRVVPGGVGGEHRLVDLGHDQALHAGRPEDRIEDRGRGRPVLLRGVGDRAGVVGNGGDLVSGDRRAGIDRAQEVGGRVAEESR
jgi:hypothetical protein